jgi:hypothetical protein
MLVRHGATLRSRRSAFSPGAKGKGDSAPFGIARVASVAAICGVLPLLAPQLWGGFRIAQSDTVLAVIASSEQALSIRSAVGAWAMSLAVGWFALAYWQHRLTLWEAALVIISGGVALARLGNAWLFALAMLVPLARQLSAQRFQPFIPFGLVALSLVVTAYTALTTRPPALPATAARAALEAPVGGTVLSDWRWAGELQQRFGATHRVLASGGLASEPAEFWVDYVRVIQGHERWAETLERRDVNVLVLETPQAAAAAALLRSSRDWRVTYDADGALVAVRTTQ